MYTEPKKNGNLFLHNKELYDRLTTCPRVKIRRKELILYCDMPTKVLHYVITSLCKSFSVPFYSIPLLLESLFSIIKHEPPWSHDILAQRSQALL